VPLFYAGMAIGTREFESQPYVAARAMPENNYAVRPRKGMVFDSRTGLALAGRYITSCEFWYCMG